MIWQSDFTFEDYGRRGEGQITILLCSSCEASAEFTIKDDDGGCCDAPVILNDICSNCKEHI